MYNELVNGITSLRFRVSSGFIVNIKLLFIPVARTARVNTNGIFMVSVTIVDYWTEAGSRYAITQFPVDWIEDCYAENEFSYEHLRFLTRG